jgi:uncharacterized membrane protein
MVPGESIGNPLTRIIPEQHPQWTPQQDICSSCLTLSAAQHLGKLLREGRELASRQEAEMDEVLKPYESVTRDINQEIEQHRTLSERISDGATAFVGSWAFLLAQGVFLAIWITINTVALVMRPIDPYPYIFLNLIISLLATIEAPLIMMSQNRQDSRDRLRSSNDYLVNLRAELEIQHLHNKLDQLLRVHWPQLVETLQMQVELTQQHVQQTVRRVDEANPE